MSFTLRWGIISTGGIATSFSQDLLVDPSTREVSDVTHKITAVGSRSVPSAQAFIDKLIASEEPYNYGVKHGALDGATAYGSYDEVFADPNVDAVYIGTPHTFHHANTKAALLAGKHVLCEKPFTLDVEELDELVAIAKEKKLFLMEAVWTRFFPIAYAVQDVLHSGKLGKVKRIFADFSMDFKPDDKPFSSRMVDPALLGGSLLDQGPYPSVWAMLTGHQHPDNKDKDPQVVSSYQSIYERSGVDASSHWIVKWKGFAEARLLTDMTSAGYSEACVIVSCEEADLVIANPPYRPDTFHIVPHLSWEQAAIKEKTTHHYPFPAGRGMYWEADEVARCIRDGKTESARMPLDESRITQGWLDVVRKQGGSVLKDLKGTAGK